MRNMHKYEELTPFEFNQEKERASIIYVSAGPMEYHEECNVLGIDPLKGYQWCLEAAEITGGIVFPMLPVAPDGYWPLDSWGKIKDDWGKIKFGEYSREPMLYPSMMFSREVCKVLYREMLETFATLHKFKLCVFIGSHGPAGQLVKSIVAEENGIDDWDPESYEKVCGRFHGMEVMAVGSLDYSKDLIEKYYKERQISRINHGGLWETAMNYAVNPDYFHPEYLDDKKYPQHYGSLKEEHVDDCVRPVRSEYRKFTPEFAEELHRTTVQRMAENIKMSYNEILKKQVRR